MSDISISNLRGCNFSSLYKSYTAAFSDYFVPYHISEEQLKVGLQQVDYDPTLSFGAFEKSGRMIGFWLSACEQTSAERKGYGVGTGIIRRRRRGGIGTKLLAALEQEIAVRRIMSYSLEVDQENEAAIEFYANCGFEKSAVYYLYCAETLLSPDKSAAVSLELKEVSLKDLSAVHRDYLEYLPSSYNTIEAMRRIGNFVRAFIVEGGGSILGYGIIQPDRSRIRQLGISEGDNATLAVRMLFKGLSDCSECTDPLHITGVPDNAKRTIEILRQAGFVQAGLQYEMTKEYRF